LSQAGGATMRVLLAEDDRMIGEAVEQVLKEVA
jgi:DNA-binding response OmpR family regulator